MNTVVIIPARAGSSRILNKNLQDLNGTSLLQRSIDACRRADCGRVIVSTDSPEIANAALACGADVPFFRPNELSTDTATSVSVIIHALKELEEQTEIPDIIIFKPPTNPFLKPETIRNMVELKMANMEYDSVLSIFRPRTSALSFVGYTQEKRIVFPQIYDVDGFRLYDAERSQDRPPSYAGSPACKVTNASYFKNKYLNNVVALEAVSGPAYSLNSCIGYEIERFESFDIDEPEDLLVARAIESIYLSRNS